jgi:ABC-type dipeptide/oligopeptide/nickel transport system permease component
VVVFALPGDPLAAFGRGHGLSAASRAALTARYHLDDSIPSQFIHWAGRIVHGDLGESRISRRPVTSIISDAFPNTIRLTVGAFIVETIVGIGAGVFAAIAKRPFLRALVLVSMTLVVTVPVFVLATSLQYLLGVRWGWLPIAGTDAGFRSWILPSVVLALPSIALISRITQTSVERSATTGYVELAVAKGASPWRIVTRHRLRNGLVPVVTFLGLDLAGLVGGALFVETVFNLPGMGFTIQRALLQQDADVVVGCSLILIAAFIVANLIVDVVVALLDPRVQHD